MNIMSTMSNPDDNLYNLDDLQVQIHKFISRLKKFMSTSDLNV